ncbi:hypothetical protein GGX14DRAFT_428259 [Mycena pura]|uniref:Uncharacterized protein n=1 Tax=Mycena pura TaxID=153505 RepID=A0AAD6VXJ2_9AGAR|nr:hypothetical protein GGX14DRAFT_428259 [Mycena pura]
MSTDDAILQNAAYHAQLLAAIAELDYVPPALEQQTSYIQGIEVESRKTAEKIKVLEKKTTKERKEHEALRDSTARRFAAKITGRKEKFEAKASKEEREYVEALEREMQEKRQKATLDTMISEASAVKSDLENKLQRYNRTKQDLAALYSKVFDGPTQAYPEDDRLENDLQMAQGRYNEIQGYLNRESQAVNLLKAANSAMAGCARQINEALSYSTWDMFGGGGLSDMMERNALSNAEGSAQQAATYVQQAMLSSSQVQPIGEISIAHGSILTDIVFDNVFTDMMFHDKIKATQRNVEAVQYNLTNQLNLAKGRMATIGADLNAAANALASARAALDAFRRSVFDRLAGGLNIPSLPAYEAADGRPVVGAQATMPQGPQATGSYAPPPGPPPSGVRSPSPGSYAPPPFPPSNSSMPSYTPPPGPPPSGSTFLLYLAVYDMDYWLGMSLAPGSYTPLPSEGAPQAPTASWGSRNPYAAALVASPQRSHVELSEKS